VRFALLFSAAAAASGGYVVGQMGTHKKVALFILVVSLIFSMSVFSAEEKLYMVVAILLVAIVAFTSSFKRLAPGVLEDAAIFGVPALLIAVFVSSSIQTGNSMGGMEISSNWYDMMDWLKEHSDNDTLVMTWWDPGHIITGYTGLKVQADGAHCGPGKCIPYNHNIRIQDTGRMFTTDDENVSLQLIRKYTALTSEQCELVRDTFGSIVPENACDPVTQVYIIASSDLIGKY
jgi:asparagine N-glycosylation enzyme membrane subunit Stt3